MLACTACTMLLKRGLSSLLRTGSTVCRVKVEANHSRTSDGTESDWKLRSSSSGSTSCLRRVRETEGVHVEDENTNCGDRSGNTTVTAKTQNWAGRSLPGLLHVQRLKDQGCILQVLLQVGHRHLALLQLFYQTSQPANTTTHTYTHR